MEDRFSAGKKVAAIGIAMNIMLLAFKLFVGYAGQSQAMIADGFNSMGDVFASTVTLAGSVYAAKPRDEDHAWGHGKAEYIASMMIGFSMIAMAVYTITGSVTALAAKQAPDFSWWLIGAAVTTICVKGSLYVYCIRKSRKYDSLLIRANAQDHRNDVFVTSGTMAAIFLSAVGFYWVDGAVGIAISVWIVYTGFHIIKDAAKVLMDTGAATDALDEYRKEIMEVDGVDHIDSVVAKPVGAQYILIVKISVNQDMRVLESHQIAKRVENHIMETRPEIDDVIVHINPDLPH